MSEASEQGSGCRLVVVNECFTAERLFGQQKINKVILPSGCVTSTRKNVAMGVISATHEHSVLPVDVRISGARKFGVAT